MEFFQQIWTFIEPVRLTLGVVVLLSGTYAAVRSWLVLLLREPGEDATPQARVP